MSYKLTIYKCDNRFEKVNNAVEVFSITEKEAITDKKLAYILAQNIDLFKNHFQECDIKRYIKYLLSENKSREIDYYEDKIGIHDNDEPSLMRAKNYYNDERIDDFIKKSSDIDISSIKMEEEFDAIYFNMRINDFLIIQNEIDKRANCGDDEVSIKEFLKELESLDLNKEVKVEFDGNIYSIREICSWRGCYSDMAIIIRDSNGSDYAFIKTAIGLYNEIKEAVEDKMIFNGYKGGEFVFEYDSSIWIELDRSGNTCTTIESIIDKDDYILIKTKKINLYKGK